MKNLTKVSLVTLSCFLLIFFCGYSLAETSNSPAASVSPAVKASEKTTFPTQSVPGLYVNKSPAFSVSYPPGWVEKEPDMSGCVFRGTSTEGLPVPSLRIFVIKTMGAPLEYAAGLYLQEIAKTFRDVKLLYDKQTQREDGNPAREAEFEWTDTASEIRLKGLYVTTRKGDEWVIVAIIDRSKGEIDDGLKKIAHSLKFKPEGQLDKDSGNVFVESGKISRTAIGTTVIRAIGALDPNKNVRTNDTFAEKFIRALAELFPEIDLNKGYDFLINQIKSNPPSLYYYINIRTKHIDAILSDSLKNKVKQVVNLGAGYDSRAYRFHQIAPEVKYFELDLPEMITDKKIRVKELLGALPAWVSYVPIDFNKQALQEELIKAGYDKNKKTLFIWEGVTYYISKEAVKSTLQFVANQSSPGSSIVFDYLPLSIEQFNTYKEIYGWKDTPGEPITYGIEEGILEIFLDQLGLKLVSNLGLLELADKYHISLSAGELIGVGLKIAYAIVRGSD